MFCPTVSCPTVSCRINSSGRLLLISAAAFIAAVSPARSQISTPITPTSDTRNYEFPPVGLASSETASITVVNTATSSSAATGTPPSCTGTISFSNSSGAIGTPATFTVGAGGFQTVTLPFASAGLTGNRGEIQGKVSLAISSTAPAPCSLMLSLETYDSTTFATHAVLSNATAILAGSPGGIMFPLLRN
jgi:hypothetical protein